MLRRVIPSGQTSCRMAMTKRMFATVDEAESLGDSSPSDILGDCSGRFRTHYQASQIRPRSHIG